MRKFQTFLLFIIVFLYSCRKERFPGYKEISEDIYFKLLALGDENKIPQSGDYLLFSINYQIENNFSFKLDDELKGYISYEELTNDNFRKTLAKMNEGDSAVFLISKKMYRQIIDSTLVFLNDSQMVKGFVKLEKVIHEADYKIMLAHELEELENRDIAEQQGILKYLQENKNLNYTLEQGIYHLPIKEGKGPRVREGSLVSIYYKGSFLDGKEFDANYQDSPLEFQFISGHAHVIKGLEIGIPIMREGGKAKFIISSQLAFGHEGSSSGIIPPYTSVIYEVELLKVK